MSSLKWFVDNGRVPNEDEVNLLFEKNVSFFSSRESNVDQDGQMSTEKKSNEEYDNATESMNEDDDTFDEYEDERLDHDN